jgi:hypothetical protein
MAAVAAVAAVAAASASLARRGVVIMRLLG